MRKKFTHLLLNYLLILGTGFYANAQQLGGVYTIDNSQVTSATNFQTFPAAIDTLAKYGVDSIVIFKIASGTYTLTGTLTIPAISGASDTSYVTFQSAALHRDSVKINYNAGTNVPIIGLDGAKYINFKYLTVASTSSNGRAFQLTGAASYDSIVNCKISAGNQGIIANPISGKKNVFSYNAISSAYGVILSGASSLYVDSNVINFNLMTISNNVGIQMEYVRYSEINGNQINSTYDGISTRFCQNIYVTNNSITSVLGSYGIYHESGSNQHFYHNTILGNGNGIYVYYTSSDANNAWKNNVITSLSQGYVADITNGGTNNIWDYNLYYTNGSRLFYDNDKAFALWVGSGQDANTRIANPNFISGTNLAMASGCMYGTPLPSVPRDIAGNLRTSPPTIGAYEYSGNDNVSVNAIFQPTNPITPGIQNIIISVKNTGRNNITSFTVSYSLNNGVPVSQSWSGGTLLPCDTVLITFTGVNLLGHNVLYASATNPNSSTSTFTGDDTLKKVLSGPMNGTYTIGSSGANFISFSDAVASLVAGGISGPVIFNAMTGTYNEKILIPYIAGSSATNTIIFQSSAQNADSVILTYAAGLQQPIVKLAVTNNIHFKYITVKSSTTSGLGFELTETASRNSITYCKIDAGNYGIYARFLTGGKNTFNYNTFTNSNSMGILIEGISTARTDSNVISGNTFIGVNTGLFLYYLNNTIVTNNSIYASTGIRNQYSIGNRFYHNSIRSMNNHATYVNYATGDIDNQWINNIITANGTGNNANAVRYTNTPGLNNIWDYNQYHTNGSRLFYNSSTAYATWLLTGQDKHSVVYRPAFTGTSDLSINLADSASWAINGRAQFLSGIVGTDINGNSRPTTRAAGVPDIGASEITPTVKPPLATASGLLANNSLQTFVSPIFKDTIAQIKWPLTGTIPTSIEVRQYSGVAPIGITAPNKFMYFYTDIKPNTGTGYFYDSLSINYYDNWLGTITAEQDLRLIRKPENNPWAFSSSAVNSVVDISKNLIIDIALTDFGQFTGTDLINPLPVELLSFRANTVSKEVTLSWMTATEINSNFFIVERSENNKIWSPIGNVKANGNTSLTSNYQLNDLNAFAKASTVFYRLRIVDNDGSFDYSKTITVSKKHKVENGQLAVYPNPFNTSLTLEWISDMEGTVQISIFDITGKTVGGDVTKHTSLGNNLLPVATDHLKPGVYFLSVEINGEKQNIKIVKQ